MTVLKELSLKTQKMLEAAMGKMGGSRRAVMFSGGFDSMLMARLARQCGARVTAVTVQFEDFNSLTVAGSAAFADKEGIAHHVLHVNAAEFLSAFEALAGIVDEPVLDLDLAVVHAALKKYDPAIAGKVFISGMGSDQWFGNDALKAGSEKLEARLDKVRADQEDHRRVAQAYGYKFIFPFLSDQMLALSQLIPPAMKKDKKLLRTLAAAQKMPRQTAKSEVQVPLLMRNILIKKYGRRASPGPVSVQGRRSSELEQALKQTFLGLWLEKKSLTARRVRI